MLPSFLITFRETLEAALVVGIILTYLTKTHQLHFKKYVWQGLGIGVAASILLAFGIEALFGGLEGQIEKIFEGVLMFVTAGFLTWMILWIHKQKDVVKNLKKQVSTYAKKGQSLGIVTLIAMSVFREGTETVLYLNASSVIGMTGQMMGAIVGIATALIIGYALFHWALKVRLDVVFNITSFFLILFAAGLIGHAMHEFQELGIVPVYAFDPLWNISSILNHNDTFGSFMRTLFGYTSTPTLVEVTSYSSYIVIVLMLQKLITRKIILK